MSDGVVARVLEEVLAAAPAGRHALVGIDGIGASGKTTFAETLAQAIRPRPVLVLHLDDFFHPSEIRHARGRHSPEGFWLDAYDYRALRSWVLEPLGADGDGWYRTHSFDRDTGRSTTPDATLAPPDAVVLVEGTFLHRDELAPFWDYSIYLDVPFEEATRRMARRDELSADAVEDLMHRYTGAQRLYFASARPWERASVVVDTTDATGPRIIEASEAAGAR